jgi:hypothetical protein
VALSVFDDRSEEPGPADLTEVLGRSAAQWDALRERIADAYPPLEEAWGFAGAKWGWSLRLKQKKRTVLYMTPCSKHFLVGFVLGEKAVAAARESGLPESVMAQIEATRKYAEGRGIRLEVRYAKDLEAVIRLASVKMAH